jgi:hypothetical protein
MAIRTSGEEATTEQSRVSWRRRTALAMLDIEQVVRMMMETPAVLYIMLLDIMLLIITDSSVTCCC